MDLRQSTSATVMLGPFVSSEGVGLVTLVISPELIRLSKNGLAFAAKNLVASNAIHDENAWYSTVFDNTDTNGVGRLTVACSLATALPYWTEFTVLPTSVYDYLYGTGTQQVVLGSSVITSATFAVGGVQRMANMLAVDFSSVSVAIGARSPINAMRILRNRVTTSGQITVYAEDDTTAVWTGGITASTSAQLVTEIDPA